MANKIHHMLRTSDKTYDSLFYIATFISFTHEVIGQSIGINGGSGESACTQIQQAYISSRAIFVITDRDTMLRY